jgi:hypothetical protein
LDKDKKRDSKEKEIGCQDGWPSMIHVCKENGKNRRLDEDKRQDSKEKEANVREKEV